MIIKAKFFGELKYKKLDKSAEILYPTFIGDCGYDIKSIEDKIIPSKGTAEIRTGLALEISNDYWIEIRTRSGHGVKNSLQVHMGVIDAGYRNEITVKVYNHGTQDYKVSKGDKICQLVLHSKIVLPLKEVTNLKPSERGLKGLGSTGK